jgi:P-type Cu2+ transporter
MVAVSVLIVTCPCALSLGTPVAMLASAGSLARRGVLVRRLQALEALAKVDAVVFDKTGTLTQDQLVIGDVQTRSGVSIAQALGMASALAQHSLHPVSRALAAAVTANTKADLGSWTADKVREIPGQGVSGWLLENSTRLKQEAKLGSAVFCGVTAQQGHTVQAYLSDSQGWVASFILHEQVRSDASHTVAELQALGLQVHLLSGDQVASVMHVAQQTGIEIARSACTPQDKLLFLRDLQNRGRMVAMVGDGLNDGPVLAGAHVSFAFGQAVPLAQAQSDFVILGQRLSDVVSTLLLARRTLRIVKQNLAWALIYNAICIPMALAGWLPAWLAGLGMALSSLVVVLNALRLSGAISPPKLT